MLLPIQTIKATIGNFTKQNTGQALNMGLWNKSLKYIKVYMLLGHVDTVMSQFDIALLVEAKAVRHGPADEWQRGADRWKALWLLLSVSGI